MSWLYFDGVLIERRYLIPRFWPAASDKENTAICCTNHSQMPFLVQISNGIPNEAVGGRAGHCFPFYVYDEDGSNRRENITDWALTQFREHYGANLASRERERPEGSDQGKTSGRSPLPARQKAGVRLVPAQIAKWDIFHYVYGILHHPGYRTKFADNLKRELPRIPFAPDFWAFADAGRELARLHLDYEKLEPYPLKFIETDGVPLSYRVEDKMRLSKDKTALRVNPSLTLAGIPPAVFDYRLGNRCALDWVIDQYRVTEDARSGIRSDPNRADDPEYIVRLVGHVVRVSLETVALVSSLPEQFSPRAAAPD